MLATILAAVWLVVVSGAAIAEDWAAQLDRDLSAQRSGWSAAGSADRRAYEDDERAREQDRRFEDMRIEMRGLRQEMEDRGWRR